MKLRDLKEAFVWMAVTSVLGVGILGAIVADSAGPSVNNIPSGPTVTMDGCKVTTSMDLTQDRDAANVVVTVQNPTSVTKQIDVPIQLVRVEFSGNPMSRSPRPDDYRETTVNTTMQRFLVGPSKSAQRTLIMSTNIEPGDLLKSSRPSYKLVVREATPGTPAGGVVIPAAQRQVRPGELPGTTLVWAPSIWPGR